MYTETSSLRTLKIMLRNLNDILQYFHEFGFWPLGSSDFPRSLCFMWFWFGLEILRLVHKKAFFKISVSILFELLTSKKTAMSLIRVEKNFFEIGRAGYQKKQNFVLISKMCRTLASRSSHFLKKTIFCKIFQVPKHSVFL